MSARTKARKRALDVLFECDLRSSDALETLARHISTGHSTGARVHGHAGGGRGRPPPPHR